MRHTLFFICSFAIFTMQQLTAQTLVHQSEKSWKIHFGVQGAAGLSTYFNNLTNDFEMPVPETASSFELNYAPRPEVLFGVFTELEFSDKFSYRTTLSYMMRAIPAPVFLNNTASAVNTYHSIYSSGLAVSGTWFFKPVQKFKVGLGYDYVHFVNEKFLKDTKYATFSNAFSASRGLRTEFVYSSNTRTEYALTVTAGNSNFNKLQVDNLTIAATIYHRLCGKMIKVKKEVYKLNY